MHVFYVGKDNSTVCFVCLPSPPSPPSPHQIPPSPSLSLSLSLSSSSFFLSLTNGLPIPSGFTLKENTRCIPLSLHEMGNRGITHQLKSKIKRGLLWLHSFNSVRPGEKSYDTRASLGRFRATTRVLTAWRIDRWRCGLFILSRHHTYSLTLSEYTCVSTLTSHLSPALLRSPPFDASLPYFHPCPEIDLASTPIYTTALDVFEIIRIELLLLS